MLDSCAQAMFFSIIAIKMDDISSIKNKIFVRKKIANKIEKIKILNNRSTVKYERMHSGVCIVKNLHPLMFHQTTTYPCGQGQFFQYKRRSRRC